MKTKIIFISGIIVCGLFLVSCSNTSENKQTPQNDQIKTDTSKTEVQANYVCPMGKECGSSDKAGKCSNCGMDLVAVK